MHTVARMILSSAVLVLGACAVHTPIPPATTGQTALPMASGQTGVSVEAAHIWPLTSIHNGAGFKVAAGHQLSEDVRLGLDAAAGWELGVDGQSEAGLLRAGRVAMRHELEDWIENSDRDVALMVGLGGGHYSEGDLTYATGDVGLVSTWPFERFDLYTAIILAGSMPFGQSGLEFADGVEIYENTYFVGANIGLAVSASEAVAIYFEAVDWIGGQDIDEIALLVGATGGIAVTF